MSETIENKLRRMEKARNAHNENIQRINAALPKLKGQEKLRAEKSIANLSGQILEIDKHLFRSECSQFRGIPA
ncbi:MAG: hypothetical protein KKG73_14570 [Gammaproteobacteria bacterium]|nr:hypothetical protein [Gammaproteobacteria bacterium]